MTVSYFGQAAGGAPSAFSSFAWCRHVVFRWRGSVWKGVGRECVLVVLLWYLLDWATAHFCTAEGKFCTHDQANNMIEFLRAYQATHDEQHGRRPR